MMKITRQELEKIRIKNKDLFIHVHRQLTNNSVLVRVINNAGTPFSAIWERQPDGKIWEIKSIDLINGTFTEEEMIKDYMSYVAYEIENEGA